MPPRRKRAPAGPVVQVSLTVGAPITPYGVMLECAVPATEAVAAYQGLVALARAMGEAVELEAHEMPQADHVPSGGPVSGDEEYEIEEARAPRHGLPRKVGF